MKFMANLRNQSQIGVKKSNEGNIKNRHNNENADSGHNEEAEANQTNIQHHARSARSVKSHGYNSESKRKNSDRKINSAKHNKYTNIYNHKDTNSCHKKNNMGVPINMNHGGSEIPQKRNVLNKNALDAFIHHKVKNRFPKKTNIYWTRERDIYSDYEQKQHGKHPMKELDQKNSKVSKSKKHHELFQK